MGPAAFVIAILGCSDGQSACQQVSTLPTQYESQASCLAATQDALSNSTDLDFPTIVAECRRSGQPLSPAAEHKAPKARPLVIASR
ncbi:hypothetical protein HMF7854_02500 [Sphingomonas ginkgonis]|uniref:Uncharacterized protein n=1 Tax=Sphingomonas ginkgonis TaxID=2315330 RepID=A0A3R9Y474_9SPHN|nr:hypothetical protein [Sphingomonas ginkgonis]RST29818.1 hypothetical protein HMF7854_02500 [Sphingomonas ginkgonis]